MQFIADAPLTHVNTLRLPARAQWCASATTIEDVGEALAFVRERALPLVVLGGGSNVVLTERVSGCVLLMRTHGEELIEQDGNEVRVRVAAGTCWHDFVLACHARGWYGLENLALIPGTVGAAPVQNIGAYGVELAGLIEEVGVIDRASGRRHVLSRADCRFRYRHSIFKDELVDCVVITDVVLRLSCRPVVCTEHAALRAVLGDGLDVCPARVLAAVMTLRRERLPDPAVLPNVGSFFHNPLIDRGRFERLQALYPEIVHWPEGERIKLAAAWLVEQAGGKNMRVGAARVHERQALVLVNEGGATAAEVLELARRVAAAVRARFDVELQIEPAIY